MRASGGKEATNYPAGANAAMRIAMTHSLSAADEPPLAPPSVKRLECSFSLSQTVPPSTSLLPDGSLAPVLSEELPCDGPCWRSPWALSRPAE